MVFLVFNRRFESYHRPGDAKGVMATRDRAAIWANRADADRVATELNERDCRPEYGELGHDDWIVVEDA
jgi:hypothetical protein